eukprot:CAMPEP_0169128796 /NCGR_PEP_ID=MMETSP1015-20121227/36774_1 /TAXON_ID=342587 /ORGANISM="Karlodinium micrum, Strain CCMP2283" /LENGTH=63 /DNA_ID=CAMNT_0009192753 /DNA_START=76 /DNA_END=267 /DNA_ORIENTATION=-
MVHIGASVEPYLHQVSKHCLYLAAAVTAAAAAADATATTATAATCPQIDHQAWHLPCRHSLCY